MPLDWDKLRVFHAVAEAGSFTHAGEVLNLSQSAVSRQISNLEERLGLPLFHRHARGLILTEQGELLFHTVRDVFGKLQLAESRLLESQNKPSGPLRITATVAFGSTWLTPRLKEFVETYPEIQVSLILNDTELDLGMREADCAIRLGAPRQSDLIQRHLFTVRPKVYASTAYIKGHGMPRTAEDLDRHPIIVYGEHQHAPVPNLNWLLYAGADSKQPRQPALRVSNVYGIFRAVQSGLGIGALHRYMAQEADNLVHILPELVGPELDAYFVYPEELRQSARIHVFRDFLLRKVAEARLS